MTRDSGGAAVLASSDKMATPSELSLEEIRKYLLENGGTARNHDVVKHFKKFLTDPETRGKLNIRRTMRLEDCLTLVRCDRNVTGCAVCKHGTDINTCLAHLAWNLTTASE